MSWQAALLLLGAAFAGDPAPGGPPPPPAAPKVDFAGLPATAVARPPGQGDKPHPVEARLIADQTAAPAGGVVRLGVHLTQDPEWHTYWKTPGDIGLPTTIRWKLPAGVNADPQVFPIPVRYAADGMVSYGYDHEVLHASDLHIPAHAKGKLTIEADVDWLVCKTSCIPGSVHLVTTVDVGPSAPSAFKPLFDHYAAHSPKPAGQVTGLTITGALDAAPVTPGGPFRAAFTLRPAAGHTLTAPGPEAWPTYVPITGPDWMVNGVEVKPQPDGAVLVLVKGTTFEPDPLPAKDAVGGLFQVQVDGAWVHTELTVPMPWGKAGTPRTPSADPVWKLLPDTPAPPAAAPPSAPTNAAAPPPPPPAPPAAAAMAPAGELTGWSPTMVLSNLLLALVGGLILNVMPCVLPVLTLKLYGLVEQAGDSDVDHRKAGVAYTAGILVSFWTLALAVWVARSFFALQVGWGFQFQYPGYVAALATLVFAFGLSLFGVFELPTVGADRADALSSKDGPVGYFFHGVFATLVATPCSAPFLGTAIAFAFQAPTPLLVLIFSAIGLGLASPFLFVAFVPAAYRFLPKPGAWMEGFKQLLGFSLMATTVWLTDVLAAQIGADRTTGFLAFLCVVALAAWAYGRLAGVAGGLGEQARGLGAAALIGVVGGWMFLDLEIAEAATCDDGAVAEVAPTWDEHIPWQPFHEKRLDALSGKTVFIDFTADWCVSCKVNERTVLESASVREAMQRRGVVPLKADWTKRDEVIANWLHRYDRAGVPMYLVIPPAGVSQAILLPEVITPDMVITALDKAAGQCGATPC